LNHARSPKALQYLQALDVCDLLSRSAERRAEFASAALFRFGLDTLATGFWIACVASEEWLGGPGQRHIPSSLSRARNNSAKFTVLSVATRRSWKNAQDEWSSKTEWHRISIFLPRLAEYVLQPVQKGSHILIEGSLTSSTFERASAKRKKTRTEKITAWFIRADVVRKLDCGEP
jgi:hypothetical protein